MKQALYTGGEHSRSRGLGSMGLLHELGTLAVPEEMGNSGSKRAARPGRLGWRHPVCPPSPSCP